MYTLGIDVGGNHIKVVHRDALGGFSKIDSYSTQTIRNAGFMSEFIAIIKIYVNSKPISQIGIGIPGTLSLDRTLIMEVPAIPELNNVQFVDQLKEAFPEIDFRLENDANVAALAEHQMQKERKSEVNSFALLTLGTGIGSAAIIDGHLFTGGCGNGMELGDIPSRDGKTLEEQIGKAALLERFKTKKNDHKQASKLSADASFEEIYQAALEHDPLATELFSEFGTLLAEGLLALIRIIDVRVILIGGGISVAFDLIEPSMKAVLNARLSPYFLKDLSIQKAILGNDAGVWGATALCL